MEGGGREGQSKEMKAEGRETGRTGSPSLGMPVCKEGRCQPHHLSLLPGLCFSLCRIVVTQSVKDTRKHEAASHRTLGTLPETTPHQDIAYLVGAHGTRG